MWGFQINNYWKFTYKEMKGHTYPRQSMTYSAALTEGKSIETYSTFKCTREVDTTLLYDSG